MLLIYLISLLAAISCAFMGATGMVRLHSFRVYRLAQAVLSAAILLTGLQIALLAGWIPHSIPAATMSILYASTAGLLVGMSLRLYRLKKHSGRLLYTPRNFWSDYGLDAAALILILFGLYRTTLFQEIPVTPIRLTSGFSLMTLGLYGWILRPVTELRSSGLLFLDRHVPVRQLLSSTWSEETILSIDCRNENESIETIYLQVPDVFERREADSAVTRLLQHAEEIRKEERNTGIST